MFNPDSFDLDIDDNFSANIFSKAHNFESKPEVGNHKEWEKSLDSVKNTSNHEENVSSSEQCHHPTDLAVKSNSSSFSGFSFVRDSRENSLKRSCAQDERPPKKRLSNDGLLRRKFPGPAGLLPDKPFKDISDLLLETDKSENEDSENEGSKEKEIVFSQNSGSMFLEPCYQKLVSDFSLNESDNPLSKYTIEWVKKTALSKGFQRRKIPFLGLVVHSVNQGISDSILVLRDPTGELNGSLHKEVWTDLGVKIRVGIALALRQVGVLISGVIRRQIYLNITMNNILSLYSPSENENQVEITTVNKVSKVELMRSFQDWLAQSPRNTVTKPSLDSPLFTTINDITLPSNHKEEVRNLRNKLENLIDQSKEKSKTRERDTEEVLANLGIMLTDSDFQEEMPIPRMGCAQSQVDLFVNDSVPVSRKNSPQMLSQAESLIFEEVLSGINLDEFET